MICNHLWSGRRLCTVHGLVTNMLLLPGETPALFFKYPCYVHYTLHTEIYTFITKQGWEKKLLV